MYDKEHLHPVLKDLLDKFVKKCAADGIIVGITQGFRSIAYQDSLYAKGRETPGNIVTNCRGGYSPHNYGLAFDFVIMDKGLPNWNGSDKRWERAGAIGESLGLTWGGRWTKFPDKPHLEFMFGLYTVQLKAGAKIPSVVKVPSPKWLKELEEKWLVRVGRDIWSKLLRLDSPAQLKGLKEFQIVRIGKSIYKNLNA